MFPKPAIEDLRQRISCLEDTQRRFLRTIPIADPVDDSLPHRGLSAGCIHEIKGTSLANAIAFSAVLSARLAGDQGNILYIAPDRSLHPLGLLPYGLKLDRVLYISTRRSQDLTWAVMEALRCSQVSAVIAPLGGLDLTESRRLQLAAETSGATGFLLGHAASAPIASPITRWKISSAVIGKSGQRFDEPVWTLDLLYSRGGRPGSWTLEWRDQKLNAIRTQPVKLIHREALAG
jgi:protein ImuA